MKVRKEIIGPCELYLGDCLDILPMIDSVDGVVTDPPYCSGGRQQASARSVFNKGIKESQKNRSDDWFLGDNMGSDTYLRWQRQIAAACCDVCTPGSPAYVFTDWRQYTNLVTAWETRLWALRSAIVWDKAKGGALGSWWRNNHEWICAFSKGKPRPLPHYGFYNTYTGVKPQGSKHPTEKPLELIKYLVESIPLNGVVLDTFMGSGTTGVACIEIGRRFIGIEINEEYFNLSCERIEKAVKAKQSELFKEVS